MQNLLNGAGIINTCVLKYTLDLGSSNLDLLYTVMLCHALITVLSITLLLWAQRLIALQNTNNDLTMTWFNHDSDLIGNM